MNYKRFLQKIDNSPAMKRKNSANESFVIRYKPPHIGLYLTNGNNYDWVFWLLKDEKLELNEMGVKNIH
jgi:hypothetical protein